METIQVNETTQKSATGFNIPVGTNGMNMVIEVPFGLPVTPAQVARIVDPRLVMEKLRPKIHSYPDRNMVGILDHMLGNLSSDCSSALAQLNEFDWNDVSQRDTVFFLKSTYAKNLVRFAAAREIATSIIVKKKPDFSLRQVMNFARYDTFVKNSDIKMAIAVNGEPIDQHEGDYQMDAKLLTNVFELIHNSAKAGARNINVNIVLDNGDAAFTVEDDGYGIKAEKIMKIFEPGYSTRPEREREGGRGGLGLFFLGQYVARHKGELMVQSYQDERNEGVTCDVIKGEPLLTFRGWDFQLINTRFTLKMPKVIRDLATQNT